MTWLKKYAPWVIIAILGMIIFYLSQCGPGSPDPGITVIHDTIPGDSVPYEVLVPQPYPVAISIPPDTFWRDADTAEILRQCHAMALDYNTIRYYDDTLKDDTSALVRVLDTVYQNKLLQRRLYFQNRRPIAINTTIYGYISRNKFYVGAVIGRNMNQFGAGASLLWTSKKNFGMSYTFDVVNMDHYLVFYYKIHKNTRN